ncbi:hypothetical protein FJ527_26470 [Mesorhizobium sp. B2-4-18]|uniref:hypothetical protein n=1 Tax=Mesorhizobium sp. B2-4-18 TaxID=2589931 RepID=UPI00112DD556|nr:hypothetical protein [Mesorhizobium sp. B2-4-18]TPK71589.1 hypothetical protein FJ527_26470 [Mesorhizobium sp. B2-4-18]
MPKLEQVDVVLCEDSRTVLLMGYDRDDNLFMQSAGVLPEPIDEDSLDQQQWRDAALADRWRAIP